MVMGADKFIWGLLVGMFGLALGVWLATPSKVVKYEERYIIIKDSDIEGAVVPCPLDQNWMIKE